jgi:L-malate glycosyltransferase
VKILIVASWFPEAGSPFAGVFIAEQARALAVSHDVTVVSTTTLPQRATPVREATIKDGYSLIRLGVPARSLLHHLDYTRAIIREIRKTECDVVHAHVTLPAGFAAVLAARWTGCAVVITEHRGPFAALMETPRDRLKVRFALDRADEVIAVSGFLADQIRSYGIKRPITVVPNVVDTVRFSETPSKRQEGDPYKLLFAGILRDHNKNLPLLLRVMKRLAGTGKYQLTVVGDGEVRAECERLALELGISEQCRFLGALDPSRLKEEIACSDVFVLPSKAETFGIVAAEAISVGRPVVATRCGGPEDFITSEVGVVVENNDEQALAKGIEDTCRNLNNYDPRKLSEYARAKFGCETIVSRLMEIYRGTERRGATAPRAAMSI